MRVGSLNLEIKNPFIEPRKTPTPQEIAKARKILLTPRAIIVFTVTYWPEMAMAANETSIPPQRRTIKTPTAKIAVPAPDLIRSNIFSRVKNEGLIAVTKLEKTTKIRNKYTSVFLNSL